MSSTEERRHPEPYRRNRLQGQSNGGRHRSAPAKKRQAKTRGRKQKWQQVVVQFIHSRGRLKLRRGDLIEAHRRARRWRVRERERLCHWRRI